MSRLSPPRGARAQRGRRAGWLLIAALSALGATAALAQPAPPDPEGEPAPPAEQPKPAPPADEPPVFDPESGEGTTPPAAPPAQPPPTPPDQEDGTPPVAPAQPAQPGPIPPELSAEAPAVLLAPFTLTINTVVKGETILALTADDVFVQPSELEYAGMKVPPGRVQEFEGLRFLSLKSVAALLKYELDEREIELRITAPVDLLPNQVVDLGSRPSDIVYQTPTSMFLNYMGRVTKDGDYDVYEELGVSHGGDLMFTSMAISNQNGPHRGVTNYTINERSSLRRLILGDAAVNTGLLGSNATLAGWTLMRSYDLDPYKVKQPGLKFVGNTMTPASLDVYVNGVRVRTVDLSPGRYELQNLRSTQGAGTATYVVRDVFGNEQVVDNPFYMADILSKGLDEFIYSVGVLREDIAKSWDYGRPALFGQHRYGLTNWLTVGARVEASEETISGGPDVGLNSPVGETHAAVGGSGQRGAGGGWAGTLNHTYISSLVSGGVYGSLTSDRYATVTLGAESDRTVADGGAFLSVPIKNFASTGATGSYRKSRDQGSSWQNGVNMGLTYFRRMPIQLEASLIGHFGTIDWQVSLTVNYAVTDRHVAAAAQQVSSQGNRTDLSFSKPLHGNGYGYRTNASYGGERRSADATFQYQHPYGRYSASYYYNDSTQYAVADAAGALVLIPHVGLFATLPAQDGFGVIRLPGVAGVRAMLNNQEIGKTDRNGNALVPNLLSYYGNRIGIKLEDLPMTYQVNATELVLAPPQRGAVVAEFPIAQPKFHRGIMVVEDKGKRIVPTYGQIRMIMVDGFEAISPLGEQGEFELQDVAAGTYKTAVDYAEGTCVFKLTLPESGETVIEVGEQVCRLR